MQTSQFAWIPTQAPTIESMLGLNFQPVPIIPVIAGLLALAYIAGWIRLRVIGRKWPAWRGLLFLSGCLLLALTMGLAVEGYGFVIFSVFIFQQLTLMMAVPPLLLLGAPGTLLLRATPHNRAGRVLLKFGIFGLRSWIGKVLIHPVFALPLFLFLFYGLYLSDLAGVMLGSVPGHIGLELLFLIAGLVFNATLVPADPLPIPTSYVSRLLHAFFEAGLYAFFGVIVMMATTPLVTAFTNPPAAWGIDPMSDQYLAGGIAWAYGEVPSLAILLVVMVAWSRSEAKNNRFRDREVAAKGDVELDAYNEYLLSLDRGRASESVSRGANSGQEDEASGEALARQDD